MKKHILCCILTIFAYCYGNTYLYAQADMSYQKIQNPNKPYNHNQGDVLTNLEEKINYQQITKATLQFQNLRKFPLPLLKCTNIEEIDLSHNQISEIPNEIGQLKKLRRLYLNDNQIQKLPENVYTQLPNLEVLYLQNNQKNFVLSPNISQLTKLQQLQVSKLETLPETVWQLKQLQTLRIWNAHLTQISSNIKNLTRLEVLCLRGNNITQLPPEIFSLKQLTYLSLGENQISSIDSQINQLQQLGYIAIDTNPIQALPIIANQLPKLQILSCWDTNIDQKYLDNIIQQFPLLKMYTSKSGLH